MSEPESSRFVYDVVIIGAGQSTLGPRNYDSEMTGLNRSVRDTSSALLPGYTSKS